MNCDRAHTKYTQIGCSSTTSLEAFFKLPKSTFFSLGNGQGGSLEIALEPAGEVHSRSELPQRGYLEFLKNAVETEE